MMGAAIEIPLNPDPLTPVSRKYLELPFPQQAADYRIFLETGALMVDKIWRLLYLLEVADQA
ncbi:MAG: hypothetical protein ACE5K3_01165 [bacterium]